MVSCLTSSYQSFYITSIESDRFRACIGPYGIGAEIQVPISSLKLYDPRLDRSFFQVGDTVRVRLMTLAGLMTSKPAFTSVYFKKDETRLNIITPNYHPATISLRKLGDFSGRIPAEGKIKIFHRNGKILLMKAGSKVAILKESVKKVYYITDMDTAEITICDKMDCTGEFQIIAISDLKKYNREWTASELQNMDKIEVKYDSRNAPVSYKLLLSPTQVTRYGDTYQFNISDFGMKAMTESQLGDAAGYLSTGMTGLKTLHNSGNIRAFLYKKNIIRLRPNLIYRDSNSPGLRASRFDTKPPEFNPPYDGSVFEFNISHLKFNPTSLFSRSNQTPQEPAPKTPLDDAEDSFDPDFLSNYKLNPHISNISRPEEIKSPKKTPVSQTTMNEHHISYPSHENPASDSTPPASNQPPKSNHSRSCSNISSNSASEHAISSDQESPYEDSCSSLNISCVSAVSTSNLNPDYHLSRENNGRIHIKDIKNPFNIQDAKYKHLSKVFSYGRLFIHEAHAYFKAIGVGYLDHLCRGSTHPNVLNHFIANLESNSGYFKLSIQSEDNRIFLIEMLKGLALRRSMEELNDHYSHTDFMEAYIKELQNITYNSMLKMKVKQDILESLEENELEPKDVLKYIGNALGMIIFTHSTHDTQPKKFTFKGYSYIMNLIVSSRYKACLLYYNYLDGEDRRVPTNKDKFKCKKCGLLPHETYFFNISGNTCQRCHFDRENKPGRQSRASSPPPPQRKEKKVRFQPPAEEEQPQELTHECDGCKDTVPIKQLKNYCSNQHILCAKCVIISNKKKKCISCGPQPARQESKKQEATRQGPTNRSQTSQKSCMQCKRRKASKFLICRHFFCSECLEEHIDSQIMNTPLSVHMQAGVVSLTCPASNCGRFISSKIFYPMILPSTKITYENIVSSLPKEECSNCDRAKPLPHLIDLECHKFCKNCLLEYFDSKLNKGKVNFKCIHGCDYSFEGKELKKLMNPKQYEKFEKIKSGKDSADQVQPCPGCNRNYFNVQTYPKFKCKQCDSKFCGDCGKVYKIRGKRKEGEHRTSCSFFYG